MPRVALAAVALLGAGCGAVDLPCTPIDVVRTPTELRISVPTWSTNSAQEFVCPAEVRVEPGERPVAVVGSYGCVDLGVAPAAGGLQAGLPFDSLGAEDRELFDKAASWSVFVIENPAPEDRQGVFAIHVIPGGPIDQVPPPPSAAST